MLVPDNLKAAVVKTDRYEPSINKVLEDMGNHYGTVVVPARPAHPKDKANVEGNVRLIYMRVFAELRNETFYSIDELNRAAASKMLKHNQKRMQKNPYTREERFLAIDKPNLKPLPPTDFEIISYTDLKVSVNCCIYFGRDKHYYSVPYAHISKTAHVAYTRTLLKIYIDGELIHIYERDPRSGYTIVEEHLASNSSQYRGLSANTFIERADRASAELGEVVRRMFYSSSMPPETHYKTCDGLFSLQRNSDQEVFRQACLVALNCGRYSYKFIRALVESKCAGAVEQTDIPSPPEHDNIRGSKQFR